jgi:hypothetical protein
MRLLNVVQGYSAEEGDISRKWNGLKKWKREVKPIFSVLFFL